MIAALTHARGARRFQRAVRPSCAEQTDRLEPALRLLVDVAVFVLADCCSQIGATMELGRSWRSMLMSAGAGGQARRGTGSSQQIGKSAALTVGALALARAAPRRMGTERPSEFGRVHHDRCPHARARRAPIPASCATELRRADRPARAGAAAVGRRRRFRFSGLLFADRGDDGARPIVAVDADVGGRRRASAARYGVIATDRKICSTDSGGACSRSRSAAADGH